MSVFEVYLCSWFLGGKKAQFTPVETSTTVFPLPLGHILLLSFPRGGGRIWWNITAKIRQVFFPSQVRQHLESMLAHIPNISKSLGLLKQLPMNFLSFPFTRSDSCLASQRLVGSTTHSQATAQPY